MNTYRKIASFRDVSELKHFLAAEKIDLPLADVLPPPECSALAKPIRVYGKTVGNRWAVLPMEGWDCAPDGAPGECTRRRWLRFAESGAKLLAGVEAAAVTESGRSNPKQLMISHATLEPLRELCAEMREVHRRKFGRSDDFMIGLQLTHSGRFSHPHDPMKAEPRTACAHPLLDEKFHCSADDVIPDGEIRETIEKFVEASDLARRAGFDFADIKHAHGYLGHELLGAVTRPGPYGGSFENRTRFFREIAEGVRRRCPGFPLAVRLSIFDIFPFVRNSSGGGDPMSWPKDRRYDYAFGGDGGGMRMDPLLEEPAAFARMMADYGVELICASVGSPYYNVHLQRPAYYAVSDGYAMPENPLYNVARHLEAARVLKRRSPGMRVIGSGYTCLQEFLPYAAEYAVASGDVDFVGIGRMALPYPDLCDDLLSGRPPDRRRICRTFGECTNAPRAGIISGCYPLDEFYRERPENAVLKQKRESLSCGNKL